MRENENKEEMQRERVSAIFSSVDVKKRWTKKNKNKETLKTWKNKKKRLKRDKNGHRRSL